MSPRSQAASIPRERSVAATEAMRSAAPPMSPARSRHTVRDPDTTPTPSRAGTPDHLGLNAEEQRLVQSLLGADPMTRTSFALSTMAPSMLESEIQHSHFHDLELCQLLHALDEPMGEPVKKAVRKAVRARVKKLGMKYDNEVRICSRIVVQRPYSLTSGTSLSRPTANPTTIMILLCISPLR